MRTKLSLALMLFATISWAVGEGDTLPLQAQTKQPAVTSKWVTPLLSDILKAAEAPANAAAQVLHKQRLIQLGDNLEETNTTYIAIRLNDAQVIPYYSQFELYFDEYYESLNIDMARVQTAAGEVIELSPSAIQIKTANDALFYNNSKVLTFSLPKLMAGTIIEVQYTRTTVNPYIEGHWFHNDFLGWHQRNANNNELRYDRVDYSSLEVRGPKHRPLYVHLQSEALFQASTDHTDSEWVYRFSRKNAPAIEFESMMPPIWYTRPAVVVTSMQNWNEVSDWSDGHFRSAFKKLDTEKIHKLAQKIIEGSQGKQEQLHKIYAYVQKHVRYVYAHLDRGGFTPHSPNWTLEKGFGDCKDQTALLVALFNAIGVEAHAALYNTNGLMLLKQAPRSVFDHMMVYVPAQPGLEEHFVDASNTNLQYPGMTPANNSTEALVISGENKGFVKVRTYDVAYKLNVAIDYVLFEHDRVNAKLTLSGAGYFDHLLTDVTQQPKLFVAQHKPHVMH